LSDKPDTDTSDSPDVDMVDLIRKLTGAHPEALKTLESFGYSLPEPAAAIDDAPIDDAAGGALLEEGAGETGDVGALGIEGATAPEIEPGATPAGPKVTALEDTSPSGMKSATGCTRCRL